MRSPQTRSLLLVAGVLALGTAVWVWRVARTRPPTPEAAQRPLLELADGYVSSRACQSCHPDHYASWHRSYHRSMTQLPTPEIVAAPFADTAIQHRHRYRLFRRGDAYLVSSDNPAWRNPGEPADAPARTRRIALVTGSHHQQFYWFESGRGRLLGLLPFAYRLSERRWVPYPYVTISPGPELPDELEGHWNRDCVRCHTTHPRPRLFERAGVDTRVAELGIACEACHGPGAEHVAANRDPQRRYRHHLGDGGDPTITNPARLAPDRASEVCGSCHAVQTFRDRRQIRDWSRVGFRWRPGQALAPFRNLVRYADPPTPGTRLVMEELDPDYLDHSFWPDGTVAANGREYTALVESACYTRGALSCLSCHAMHQSPDDPRPPSAWADDQLRHDRLGDESCAECHPAVARDVESHAHHPAGSSGSRCVNCHMPNTAYGLLKASRSHRIDSPSAARTLESERPNACNLCHLDRTLAWSAEWLARWYGIPRPAFGDPDHERIAAGWLDGVRAHAGVRALAAWHLGWGPAREVAGAAWMAPLLAELLADPYAAVRQVAYRSLESFPALAALRYDPLGPPAEWQRMRRRVLAAWAAAGGAPERAGESALLLDGSGGLERAELEALVARRDDRPVYRQE